MTFNIENRRYLADGHIERGSDLDWDIATMDDEQLERLVRLTFEGERDYDFLPYDYWRSFSPSYMHGGGDRGPLGAGQFFGGLYVSVGEAREETGEPVKRSEDYEEINPDLRTRLEAIFIKIADECLLIDKPTEADIRKAQSVTVAAANISFSDRWDSVEGKLTAVRRRPCPQKQELFDRVLALRERTQYAEHMPYECFSFRNKPPVNEK